MRAYDCPRGQCGVLYHTNVAGAGATLAVYGHLHGEEDHAWAPRGSFRGTYLWFVAADFTGFRPVEVYRTGPAD